MSRARDALGRIVLLAAAIAAATLSARSDPRAGGQPAFRAGVHVVEVDARVFDEDGRFIADLTRGDFVLLEDGVPQPLLTLDLIDATATRADEPLPASEMRASRAGSSTAVAGHTWVFVFDTLHLASSATFTRARQAVEAFIRHRVPKHDLAGIVVGARLVNDRLTSDRDELVASLRRVQPPTEARGRERDRADAAAGVVGDEADAERRAAAERLDRGATERAASSTLSAVNALGSALARMPGTKTVVLISDGFPTAGRETTLRSVAGQMARSGARLYAIDARGNRAGRDSDREAAAIDRGSDADAASDARGDGLHTLAAHTGGLVFRNANDVGRALDRIARDADRYYVLRYQPASAVLDGKFRAIEVRVSRRGARVRARRGYLALEPSRMLVAAPIAPAVPSMPAPPARDDSPATETVPSAPARDDSAPSIDRNASTTTPAPRAPDPAAATASVAAAIVSMPARPAAGAVRLRPGATERILEIAGGEPASADALAHQGWDAYQRGDVETAVGLFAQAATKPDVRPWVIYTLGLSHAALGHPADAITSWERVRQLAPDFKSVYMDLADTYVQTGDVSKALAVLRAAQGRWQADAEMHNAMGVIHVRRGALDDAIARFSTAAEIAPADALTHWNLGRAYELRYERGMRYVSSQRAWVADEADRQRAMRSYKRCVELGGPYAPQAAEAISRLEWARR